MENIQIIPGIPLGEAQLAKLAKLKEESPAVYKKLAQVGNQVTLVTQQSGIPATPNSEEGVLGMFTTCLLYTSPSPRDRTRSRMPSSA